MWDATCTDTFTPSLITVSSAFPGSAATAAKDLKRMKYASLASSGYHFVPFSVETSGVIATSAIALIKEVGCHIADREDDSHITSFHYQRISHAIIRGNSFSILGSGKRGEFS